MVRCCRRCLLDSVRTSRAVVSSFSDGTRRNEAAFCRRGVASAGAPQAGTSCGTALLERRRRGRASPLICSGGEQSLRAHDDVCVSKGTVRGIRPARRGTGCPLSGYQQPRFLSWPWRQRLSAEVLHSPLRRGRARSNLHSCCSAAGVQTRRLVVQIRRCFATHAPGGAGCTALGLGGTTWSWVALRGLLTPAHSRASSRLRRDRWPSPRHLPAFCLPARALRRSSRVGAVRTSPLFGTVLTPACAAHLLAALRRR